MSKNKMHLPPGAGRVYIVKKLAPYEKKILGIASGKDGRRQ